MGATNSGYGIPLRSHGNLMRPRRSPLWVQFPGTNPEAKRVNGKGTFIPAIPHMEERLSHRPPQLSPEEWVQLVEFWDTPEHQAVSKRNRANCAKQIVKHTAGRISFPQFAEIMSEKAGAPPSLGDLSMRSHISLKMHDALDDQLRDYIVCMSLILGSDASRVAWMCEVEGTRCNTNLLLWLPVIFGQSRERLGNQVAEMQRVVQEKEEERQHDIEEIRRQAQEKDEQRQREIDEMKRQFDARDADIDARLMQKLFEMITTCSLPFSN
ncbi:hypothetical protein IFM89_015446 [Coptis chinensis]|uniref:Uncharacterized protein n=1 Tax=Coptis chinensis TaxID=261450 RepID=A0A835MCS8_9MAGN|nr:hypothetical protein IFM89_015446 [Coptis chinensis]